MTMKNVFAAVLVLSASPAFAAGDIYDCEMTLVEDIQVLQVHFNEPPAGQDIDFQQGIPAHLVTATREITPGIFNGSYADLRYHSSSSNGKGVVLFTTEFRHPVTSFSFSTDFRKTECNPNAPYTYQCYVDFLDASGALQNFGMIATHAPKDALAPLNAEYEVWTNGFIDTRDNSLELQLMFHLMHFKANHGMVMKQGTARVNYADRPQVIKFLASTITGMQNNENPGDDSEGSYKSDDVELVCHKR